MKLSPMTQRIGKYTCVALQHDNGPWVGVVVADYDTQFISDEDALRYAVRLAMSKKRTDELAAEHMRLRAKKRDPY